MKRENIISDKQLKDFGKRVVYLLAIIGILLLIDKIFPGSLAYINYYLREAPSSDALGY